MIDTSCSILRLVTRLLNCCCVVPGFVTTTTSVGSAVGMQVVVVVDGAPLSGGLDGASGVPRRKAISVPMMETRIRTS